MAQWKKVVVSGSSLAQLDNSSTGFITSADVTQIGTTATTALRGDTTASIAANASAVAAKPSLGVTSTTALRGDSTASIAANASSAASNATNITTNSNNIALKANIASPAFTGDATAQNLGVSGNLSVAGTASFNHSENLLVKDSIILLGSGSAASSKDGGTVVYQSGDDGSMIGNFLGYQANAGEAGAGGRYGVAAGIEPDAAAVTLAEFLSTVKVATSSPTGDGSVGGEKPAFGGTSGFGSLWINSSTNEAFIYV